MFGRHVFKAKRGKCLFVNLSKDKVEIMKIPEPPKHLVVTSDKVFKIEEYSKTGGRVFVFIEGELKGIYD